MSNLRIDVGLADVPMDAHAEPKNEIQIIVGLNLHVKLVKSMPATERPIKTPPMKPQMRDKLIRITTNYSLIT